MPKTASSAKVRFTVPMVPPSVNHYKKPRGNGYGFYVTPEANAFKCAVSHFAPEADQWDGYSGAEFFVTLHIYLGPKQKGDVDNFAKVCLDSLVAIKLIKTDAKVTRLMIAK